MEERRTSASTNWWRTVVESIICFISTAGTALVITSIVFGTNYLLTGQTPEQALQHFCKPKQIFIPCKELPDTFEPIQSTGFLLDPEPVEGSYPHELFSLIDSEKVLESQKCIPGIYWMGKTNNLRYGCDKDHRIFVLACYVNDVTIEYKALTQEIPIGTSDEMLKKSTEKYSCYENMDDIVILSTPNSDNVTMIIDSVDQRSTRTVSITEVLDGFPPQDDEENNSEPCIQGKTWRLPNNNLKLRCGENGEIAIIGCYTMKDSNYIIRLTKPLFIATNFDKLKTINGLYNCGVRRNESVTLRRLGPWIQT